MSTAEDQELRDKINKLTNRINRHKEIQSNGINLGVDHSIGSRGLYHRSAPYPQQAYRGGRGRFPPTYRNRTLVLNGGAPSTVSNQENQAPDPTTPSWVTKTDRHLQLINRDVYERETQQRTQAIEQTLQQKQLNKDRRERAQLLRNMQQVGGDVMTSSNSSKPTSRYEVDVEGVRFHVTQQGSKLVKAPDDLNPPTATPKIASLFGVKFHRTKNGNLIRHGIVQAQRRAGRIKKVNERCKAFSWTGTCPKGPSCRYIHDVSKTAICRTWLSKGDCPRGDDCDLSHEITVERTPLCVHYAKGACNNPSCSYVHVEHSPSDPVCRAFGIYGYCDKGAQCPGRHVFECPDFSNTGVCKLKGCKRPHIERASILRKANKRASSPEEDLSSEDDEMVDSDDVDSDEAEEFIGHDNYDPSFAEQKDFIGFT
ncbi:hypothetical protein F5B22DRAFT_620372 [Xylaria bambusicola]|uniref:uncharacterized protein n=1 Tax=Xylaria bambusicola TaxID=326684 RepID=UPI00200760AC|nr:uncharacterized protein F5B22DRAFT_620372 [Xylaria bambusicola]KAI0508587.1 hypothetical protein F5B22DRAFT_620372 [Xylaria bambusicola]